MQEEGEDTSQLHFEAETKRRTERRVFAYLNFHWLLGLDTESNFRHSLLDQSDGVGSIRRSINGLLGDTRGDLLVEGLEVPSSFLVADLNIALLQDLATENGKVPTCQLEAASDRREINVTRKIESKHCVELLDTSVSSSSPCLLQTSSQRYSTTYLSYYPLLICRPKYLLELLRARDLSLRDVGVDGEESDDLS